MRARQRRLALSAAVVAVLVGVGWGVSASRDGSEGADATSSTTPSATAPSATASASATAGAPQPPPPTEMPDGAPIAEPSPGTPSELGEGRTVPVGTVRTEPPVDLTGTGDFGTGLTVRLTEVRSVQGVARAPGEIAGPALEVAVRATNDSDGPVALDTVVVFLSYGGDRTPASEFGHGSVPLQGDLAAGASSTGTYVFAVPEDQREDVRVEISYTGDAPTVAFEGSVG